MLHAHNGIMDSVECVQCVHSTHTTTRIVNMTLK